MLEGIVGAWVAFEAFATAGNGFKPTPPATNWDVFWFIVIFAFFAWLYNTDFDDKKKKGKKK